VKLKSAINICKFAQIEIQNVFGAFGHLASMENKKHRLGKTPRLIMNSLIKKLNEIEYKRGR